MSFDVSRLSIRTDSLDKSFDKKTEEQVKFDSLEDALKYADKDAGDEAVVEVADETGKKSFVVVDIKSGLKADSVFNPDGVSFKSALISRSNNRIELTDKGNKTVDDEFSSVKDISEIAIKNKQDGLSLSRAYNNYADKMPAYQANMVGIADKLVKLEEKLVAKKETLSGELETLKKATPPDATAISAKEKELDQLNTKIEELKTSKGILTSKLLMLPMTRDQNGNGGVPVPGTENLMVGDFRSKAPKLIEAMNVRKSELQDKLLAEKDPEKIASLKEQLGKLDSEIGTITANNLQIEAAALSIRMRVGSLASISSSIDKAQSKLNSQVSELESLKTKFSASPAGEIKDGLESKIKKLEGEIEKGRKDLISEMKKEIGVFKSNANMNAEGAKAAVSLLDLQVKKLEAVEGKSASEISSAVKEVQKNFKEELLSKQVEVASKYWDGISPQEGKMIGEIKTNTSKYLTDYASAKKEMEKLNEDIKLAKKAMPTTFHYDPLSVKDLSAAVGWTAGSTGLSGVEANKEINEAYFKLDKEFTKYITGGDAQVANWMTYGKFASREAGSQIQNLEGALEGLRTLTKFDLSLQNDKRAVDALIKIMDTGPMTQQAIRMAATSMGIPNADTSSSSDLIGSIVSKMASDPTNSLSKIEGVIKDLETLHGALVIGNTGIYANIAPAYQTFLAAEAKGEDGVAALKKAGYKGPVPGKTFVDTKSNPPVLDPQGFIVKAFTFYQSAKTHEQNAKIFEAQAKENPAKAPELLKKVAAERELRDNDMHQGNLLIGCQEQMCILQSPAVFGNPKVADMLKAMTGTMSIKDLPDGNGGFRENKLLSPNGPAKDENWADFATRMGMEDVTASVKSDADAKSKGYVKVMTPNDPKPHYFKIPNDNSGYPKGADGTISQYFADNLKDPKMISTAPRDIKPLYRDNVEGEVTILDRVSDVTPLGVINTVPLLKDGIKYLAHQIF